MARCGSGPVPPRARPVDSTSSDGGAPSGKTAAPHGWPDVAQRYRNNDGKGNAAKSAR
jgi:hypothetical protein